MMFADDIINDADETDAFVDNLRTQRVGDKHLGTISSEQV
jgi:hypothetical protein